jgi:uncharacterized radical SAM superfamily protein
MAGQTITILESDITGQSATSKAVVISRAGEPDVEIPFEAGQSLNIIESGANFQLTMTGGDSQWIIESTDLVAIEARKTSLNAIIPAVGSSSGIATEATLQSILDNQTNGDLNKVVSIGCAWSRVQWYLQKDSRVVFAGLVKLTT